ncbi:hypothetical protein GQR58_025547 [Nymphon striatum]|nr:hypothetical protein GQR58_025547 [Nymphon striatum]
MILFPDTTGIKSSSKSVETKVYEYPLTDSDMLGGENDNQSEATRLFINDDYAKTGCLITADGSNDNLIKPEGLLDYVVPPPSIVDPITSTLTTNYIGSAAEYVEVAEEEIELDERVEDLSGGVENAFDIFHLFSTKGSFGFNLQISLLSDTRMNLTNLPDVPLLHIFGYLEIGDVATLSSIHRRFDDLTGSQYICQNSNGPDERLSTVMMNDLLKIFKNYVASSDKYMDNCKFELLFHDKETFRHHFEKCPLFSANVFIESPSSWLLFFSMLITEYLEPVVKSLILRRVIEFHEVRDMLSTVLQNSISETFQNIYTIHSYCEKASFVDYVTEYLYYRLCMGYDVKEHRDDSLTSDILYKLLSNVRKMLSDAINERNKNHSSIDLKLKTNHDDFLQEKMNNFQRASHRFDKNNLAAFFRCYLKEKASKAQEELSKYIECFFFKENETENLDKKGKTSSENAVHVYFLTGVGSDDVYKSQAVTLLVNYRYAIMILEHVNMSVSLF